jgi:hypothetical protein
MKLNKYSLIAFICFVFIAKLSWSQQDANVRKKNLTAAEIAFEKADFLNAFNLYSNIIKYDTANYNAIFKMGYCLFSINKTDSSSFKYFNRSKSNIPESHFFIGRMLLLEGNAKKALEEFYYFKSVNNEKMILNTDVLQWISTCEVAIKEESRKQSLVVRNLGSRINSNFSEYVPLVWNVNGALVFTSRRADSKGGLKDPYGRFYEDIYIAQKTENGWVNPGPLSENINTTAHDACVAFSPSGTELIIYRTDSKQVGGDLYISKYDGEKWSIPEKLGPEVNSEYLETSACFSSSGNEIIFSSNRPGGFGGKDLYITRKFLNGKFSLPRNLGPDINSPEDEDAPFIDKNDNTLYFSSKGHNSIGEYDIFHSEFNNENESWGKAENIGMPINSTNDDIYFIKLDDKDLALFTSRREGGFGDADIYEVNFSESTQTMVYCTLNTEKIINKTELKDLQLSLYDLGTGKLEGIFKPNKEYMTMVLLATVNKPYKLIVEGNSIEPIINKTIFNAGQKEMTIELHKKIN